MRDARPAPARPNAILMATDLGARGDRAVDRAARLAARWRVPLHVVHAAAGPWSPVETRASLRERIRRDLPADAVDARVHVEEGDPADVILAVAAREGCELVVLGDAGEDPGRRLLGNTVDALVRRAPMSVLVVKQRPRGDYGRVVVGTDLTPESRHGLETAAALFPEAHFTLLHALDIPYESLWLDPARRDELTRMEMATIDEFATQADLPVELHRRLRLRVEHGHPEAMLRRQVLADHADLVVIGAFRRGLAFHLLVGGTTRRIVQVAPADVLVVRASAPRGESDAAEES